jgi:predicted P-loop ATPase
LERSYITKAIADAAGLFRVNSIEGRELVSRKGAGNFAGTVYPYRLPGEHHSVLNRLRLDAPPVETNGKTAHKYLTAPNERNRLYFPPCAPDQLKDGTIPLVITEGEKKTLALWRMAVETANGSGKPPFLPVGVAGVWNWRGTVGVTTGPLGDRVPEKGPLPDLDLIAWQGRKVTILFDANASTNQSVNGARRALAVELTRRGAIVWLADLPASPGVNGCDDFLYLFGCSKLQEVFDGSRRWLWREELKKGDKGQPLGILANAITTLESAPEWFGVLAFNEFSLTVSTTRPTPWGAVKSWTDTDTSRLVDWLNHNGIYVSAAIADMAVNVVAENNKVHPVREYLNCLSWDGVGRLDDWLVLYLGAESTDYVRAVGKYWLISCVARIYKPGCQVDHMLILEGPQGQGKSTALRILGEPFFCDDMPDLKTKDASIGLPGVWIFELSELEAMQGTAASRIKAFITRSTDHYRPPYGKRSIWVPRQCVFAGSVNNGEYLKDDTGGRRFWPVRCRRIDLDSLRRDRNQLLAEAVHRYRAGEQWWPHNKEIIRQVTEQQEDRLQTDPWEAPIAEMLEKRRNNPNPKLREVTTSDALLMLKRDEGSWTKADESRIGSIYRRLGWTLVSRPAEGRRQRRYKYCEASSPSNRPTIKRG